MIGRCSDEAIAACIAPTLRALYDADGGDWSRTTIAQLAGLLAYADGRGEDAERARRADLAAALDAAPGAPEGGSPYERAASTLVAADGGDRAAVPASDVVRPLLVAQLDDELAQTIKLLDAFRGRLTDV